MCPLNSVNIQTERSFAINEKFVFYFMTQKRVYLNFIKSVDTYIRNDIQHKTQHRRIVEIAPQRYSAVFHETIEDRTNERNHAYIQFLWNIIYTKIDMNLYFISYIIKVVKFCKTLIFGSVRIKNCKLYLNLLIKIHDQMIHLEFLEISLSDSKFPASSNASASTSLIEQ